MSRHLKKYAAPTSWPITRKDTVYIAKPSAGPHNMRMSMSLELILRTLGYAKTKREIKKILTTNEILVDGRRIKEPSFPVGIFDTITFKTLKPLLNTVQQDTARVQNHRIVFDDKGKLSLLPIKEEEAKTKITKINGKKTQNKGVLQLNLSDGRNILTKEKNYTVGDTLVIETPSNKIQKHLKLEQGAMIYLIDGKHVTDTGTVKTIEKTTITYTSTTNKHVQTLKQYAYVIGKDKPVITLK